MSLNTFYPVEYSGVEKRHIAITMIATTYFTFSGLPLSTSNRIFGIAPKMQSLGRTLQCLALLTNRGNAARRADHSELAERILSAQSAITNLRQNTRHDLKRPRPSLSSKGSRGDCVSSDHRESSSGYRLLSPPQNTRPSHSPNSRPFLDATPMNACFNSSRAATS
jgi:hypothetical protein